MDRDIALTFSMNLQRLMDHHGLSQAELARKTKIGQSTLSKLLNTAEPGAINPRASTVQQLAAYFCVPGWQLFLPDLPLDMLASPRLARLIENYCETPPEGRAAVDHTAENERRYAILSPPKI